MSLRILKLPGEEPDGHNAILLCCVQEPLAGAFPGSLSFEGDLVEPGQRVPHVRLVEHVYAVLRRGISRGSQRKGASVLQCEKGAGSSAGP